MVDDGAEECRKGTRLALIIRRGIRVPKTGGPNRRPPVTVYRSVSRGNRCLPSKFKFSNQTASQSVTDRFTGR
jgi:hypothetical protein